MNPSTDCEQRVGVVSGHLRIPFGATGVPIMGYTHSVFGHVTLNSISDGAY